MYGGDGGKSKNLLDGWKFILTHLGKSELNWSYCIYTSQILIGAIWENTA